MRSSSASGRTTLQPAVPDRSHAWLRRCPMRATPCSVSRLCRARLSTRFTAYEQEMPHEHERRPRRRPRSIAASRTSTSSARRPPSSTARPASCAIAAIPSTTWRSIRPSRRPPTCCCTASCRRTAELARFDAELKAARQLPPAVLDIIDAIKSAHPMDVLRTAISALAAFDPEVRRQFARGDAAQGHPAHRRRCR